MDCKVRRQGKCNYIEIDQEIIDSLRPKKSDSVKQAIEAVSRGNLVKCSKEDYHSEVRTALQKYASEMIDDGQDIYAQIALNEVKRLDKIYGC